MKHQTFFTRNQAASPRTPSRFIRVVFLTCILLSGGLLFSTLTGCGSNGEDAGDLIDVVLDPPSRKPINRAITGVHNFFNNTGNFGSVSQQYQDIRNNLGLRYVRVMIPWLESVQPSASSPYDFSQADAILNSIPSGVDVLVVLTHTPRWMTNSANWIDENPRKTWVEKFLRPVVSRYRNTAGIVGWEIFNEPDTVTVASDVALELQVPENYVDLLRQSHSVVKELDPNGLVVMAATRSIQQNWPNNLNYNKELLERGALSYTDVWNIHYYDKQFEKIVVKKGVADFLNEIGKPIWVTESGETGPNNQLAYVETTWPFLKEKISNIERFYYYEYSSISPSPQSFGLRNSDPAFPVSDFYVWLRESQK